DGVADGKDVLGRVVRNLALELFFERHDQLYGIETVRPQVVNERRVLHHLFGLDAQVLDDDLFDALRDIAHRIASFLVASCWGSRNSTARSAARRCAAALATATAVKVSPVASACLLVTRGLIPKPVPKSRGW